MPNAMEAAASSSAMSAADLRVPEWKRMMWDTNMCAQRLILRASEREARVVWQDGWGGRGPLGRVPRGQSSGRLELVAHVMPVQPPTHAPITSDERKGALQGERLPRATSGFWRLTRAPRAVS